MKVLVIGGTGYIGGAVVRRLLAGGHEPIVLARDPEHTSATAPTHVGDLTDPDSVRAAITPDIDAVVHAATPTGSWDADLAALAAMTDVLVDRTLVYLSGVWVLGPATDPVGESAPTNPLEIVDGRPQLERHVLGAPGVRGVVIRPGIVHGEGGGIPGMMTAWARKAGTGRYVGEPTVRWPMVHVLDLADLVVLALDRAPAGSVLHGVSEPAVAVKEVAVAADLAAGGSGQAEAWDEQEAAAVLGPSFAAALALHQVVTADVARRLGWTPRHLDAVSSVRGASSRRRRVLQMRLVVEAEAYEGAMRFYRDVLGADEELQIHSSHQEHVTILDVGRATLELANPAQIDLIDRVEVGHRVSPHLRVAFEVDDAAAVTEELVGAGAELLAPPVRTPWGSVNSRLQAPGDLQITVFEEHQPPAEASPGTEEQP